MKTMLRFACAVVVFVAAGCQQVQPYDYTKFNEHPPRSILVLPPINDSTAVEATYSWYSAASQPLAERGYYVFPVEVVDRFFREQGMQSAPEMQQAPLARIREVIGADAVLYTTVKKYGATYTVLNSTVVVDVSARLVDVATETVIWEGRGVLAQGNNGTGNIVADVVAAAITQAINSGTDRAHGLCGPATTAMLAADKRSLPFGPYHPKVGQPQ